MKQLLKRVYARPGIAIELGIASLFANLLALASPLFIIQVLNRYVAYGVDATLATLTAGVLIAIAFEFGFRQIRLRLACGLSMTADEKLAVGMFGVLTGAKAGALDRVAPEMRRQIVTGGAAVENAYNAANIATVLDVPFALLFVLALFLLNPVLAGIAVFVLVAVCVAGMLSRMAISRPTDELVQVSGAGGTLINTAVRETDTVRAFNGANLLSRAWHAQALKAQSLRRRVVARQALLQSVAQSATALMSVCLIAVGAILVIKGRFDVGAMIGANILAARALQPVIRFTQLGEAFAKAGQALKLSAELARLPLEITTGSSLAEFSGRVTFKDVGFSYPGSPAPVFESLDIDLAPGTTLVVTGKNGAGKSTLCRLLMGLVDPQRGHILVDGVDLRQVVPEWWRRQVQFLPQEPAFFATTVRENLRVAMPELDEEGLDGIVTAAGLRQFIDQSVHGLETPVTEGGRNLSLGIRRRLALARALATGGKLVVFDEPTEGLDAEGCMAVYGLMNELSRSGRTIIACSSDGNIVKAANYVLDLNAKPVPRLMQNPARGANPQPADGDGESRVAAGPTPVPAPASAPAPDETKETAA